jgi:uroporphyrinogen-III synthase
MGQSEAVARAWRVCVTHDEGPAGALHTALRGYGFVPADCPILAERAPVRPEDLKRIAARLAEFDWIICASTRSVRALSAARGAPWPPGVHTAAVGRRTAEALAGAGASPPPVVGDDDGAEALWRTLEHRADWRGRRVLIPTTPGGRRTLADAFRSAGASVEEVQAYRMCARDRHAIAADWAAAAPDAVVVASPRAAAALMDAVGTDALRRLRAVVAIGRTTADALAARSVSALVPDTADFRDAARVLADCRAAGSCT